MNNIFDLKTKLYKEETIISSIDSKTDHLFTAKPFRLRAYPIYILALILSIACQIASGFTEVYMLFNWLSNFNLFVCIGLVAVIALVIEGAKRWSAKELAINKGLFALSILVVMQGASIFISYKGATALPKEIIAKPVKDLPVLVDLVQLAKERDLVIANKEAEIQAFWMANRKPKEAGGWRLSSSKLIRVPYNALMDSKKTLEAEKIKSLDLARISNNNLEQTATQKHIAAIATYNAKIETDSNIYGCVSLAIELAFLLAFGVMYYYLKHSNLEKQANPIAKRTQQDGTSERTINPNALGNNVTHNVTEQKQTLVAQTERKAATFKDYNGVRKRNCNCCGKSYEYTRDDSKYCEPKCRSKAFRLNQKSN